MPTRGAQVLAPHRRFVRARYPNVGGSVGLETRSGVQQVRAEDIASYGAPAVTPAAAQIYFADPDYDASASAHFNAYGSGRCASAGAKDCPCGAWMDRSETGDWVSESYWCSNASGGGWAEMDKGDGYWNGPVLPTNVTLTPRSALAQRIRGNWSARTKAAGEAVVTAWRAQGWFVNMFPVDDVAVDDEFDSVTLKWSSGGHQGGRGWQVDGKTRRVDPLPPLYVENVLEELDEADEWYFDSAARKLYYYHNGTGAPPKEWTFVAPDLRTLLEVKGATRPVANVTVSGLGFRDASLTYLDPWGVPSGGDWALYRGGALLLEKTERATVEYCKFERLDGNALLLSAYTRDAQIRHNEFVWIGDCAIAAWGRTHDWDGTSGDQPRGTTVAYNYAHELGIYQLQSAMYFQAKTAETLLQGNVFFNGPRSGVNFNDGFGGGNVVRRNAIFNTHATPGPPSESTQHAHG